MTKVLALKIGVGVAAAAIMLAGTSVRSLAQTGALHLHIAKAGFIVSAGSGTGTLTYQGRTYQLRVDSNGFGIGVSAGELMGTAYNMRTVADIAGTYRSVAVGLTVGGGAVGGRFQNENGVILDLLGAQLGLEASLGSAGMTIALQ
jgi:hypothetical protein